MLFIFSDFSLKAVSCPNVSIQPSHKMAHIAITSNEVILLLSMNKIDWYNCSGDYRDARALIGRELRHV